MNSVVQNEIGSGLCNGDNASQSIVVAEPPRFTTGDLGECREYIWSTTGTHKFNTGRSSSLQHFSHHERHIGRVSLNVVSLSCTDGFQITKSGSATYYSFQFLLEGQCELEGLFGRAVIQPGDVFILDPEHVTREFWPAHCRQFIVQIDRRFIEQTLIDELRRELRRPVVFKPIGGRDPGIAAWLHQIVSTPSLPGTDRSRTVLADRRVIRSLERTLVMMCLAGFPHSESQDFHRPCTGAAPYYVRRAEEYVRAHTRDELTIESIAAAAGVSPRSMFYGFRRWRNTTPMAHIRELRLEIARQQLERAHRSGGTVSEAAVNAGFTNFSQFSKIYKARFGETPSMTLKRN